MDLLEPIVAEGRPARRDPRPVAAGAGDQQPLIDGKAVPLLSPGQRARIPESWIENRHRAAVRWPTPMIDRAAFLADAQKLLKKLENDLLERSQSTRCPTWGTQSRQEYEEAKEAGRTGQTLEEWRSDAITQPAAAWVLSCVFVRFLEDNR